MGGIAKFCDGRYGSGSIRKMLNTRNLLFHLVENTLKGRLWKEKRGLPIKSLFCALPIKLGKRGPSMKTTIEIVLGHFSAMFPSYSTTHSL